ncbi:uncharacterized protein LOC8028159 [Ixodes scapularis]|uniref:uncharacterized protein LOC8028159 n=1 Tax=Ixodes scapularis TaxID=6945 RepID=UPI001A9CC1BE|nr:uncharacterized protein LOC8028159 [Ixodes scapularis]
MDFRIAEGGESLMPLQDTPPDDSSLSTSSNESSGTKRNPPAKPPRRRHSVTSLKDADCAVVGSLRRSAQGVGPASGQGRTGDGDSRGPELTSQWILDPPPNFGGSPSCFSLSCGGRGGGGCDEAAPAAVPGGNDFRSLPLSVSLERKSCSGLRCSQPGLLPRSAFVRAPHPASPPGLQYPSFTARTPGQERDVPDVVSRSVLAGGPTAATCRRGCEVRKPQALAGGGAPGRSRLAAPPGSPRRTHSDPVIHLDEVDEGAGRDNEGIWTSSCQRMGSFTIGGGKAEPEPPTPSRLRLPLPEEVKALKEINAKLWNQLQHLQSQLDMQRRLKSPDGSPPPPPTGVSFAELLADVYYAQRERDDSMRERLDSASQSADLCQRELRKLADARCDASDGMSSDDENCDNLVLSGLDKIIQGLEGTWTPAKVARHQETLLATVHRLRESRGRRGRHQLRALQAQRDLALEKVKVLEKDVQELHMKAIWKSENWGSDTVQQTTNERTATSSRLYEMQETLGLGNGSGSDRTADTAKISTEAQTDFIGVEEAWDPSGAGSPLLRQLREEVRRIGQRLDDEIASRQGAELKCQRLEELVNGLQKRLNGLNNNSF